MTEKLEDVLRRAAHDPFQFDEMLEHWNAAFANGKANPVTSAVEQAVDQALLEITARDDSDLIGGRLKQLIHAVPHVALVVGPGGKISAMNEAAMRRSLLGPGDPIDNLDYELENAEPISTLITRTLSGRNSIGEVLLTRAIQTKDDRSATLAIVPSVNNDASSDALVFIIDPEWRIEVEALVARAFQLTAAESAVLMSFLDGQTHPEIAKARGTTLVTVRTQFQRIMEKTGAHSQVELMRNTLAISQFFQDMAPIAEVAGHPHRKQFDIMRPGGRSLDVTLAGDMNGLPVIILSTLSRHTFPAWYEEALFNGGILAIHMWRQGHGRSDPLPCGSDIVQGMADDLIAPLDHLNISFCPVICFEASLVDML